MNITNFDRNAVRWTRAHTHSHDRPTTTIAASMTTTMTATTIVWGTSTHTHTTHSRNSHSVRMLWHRENKISLINHGVCASYYRSAHYTRAKSRVREKWNGNCAREEKKVFFPSRSLRSATTHTHWRMLLILFSFIFFYSSKAISCCSLNLVHTNDNWMCDSFQCGGTIRIYRTKQTIKYVQITFCVCYAFSSSSVDRKLQITANMIISIMQAHVKQLCLCARACSTVFSVYVCVCAVHPIQSVCRFLIRTHLFLSHT